MKKVLSVILACVLAFAVMLPCVAEGKSAPAKSPAPEVGSIIEFGAWPQTRVTSFVTGMLLYFELQNNPPAWKTDVLPDGTSIQYADVYFDADSSISRSTPTYRVVRSGRNYQWFRWEPLTWEVIEYRGLEGLVCTSVLTTAENDAKAIVTWLNGTFFQTAFDSQEQAASHSIGVPNFGITGSAAADVGDYAALYGAVGTNYLQLTDPNYDFTVSPSDVCVCAEWDGCPHCTSRGDAAKGANTKSKTKAVSESAKSMSPRSGEIIGVRPLLVLDCQAKGKGAGIICCLLKWLFGHHH
ncbi:MAG: hypothetical protein IJT44_07625 [Clostridia bacterium]|nr:hypothetical protein [Clostridia bacterium]